MACAIEEVDAIVELVDAELIEDEEYTELGVMAIVRVKGLLGRLNSVHESKRQGNSTKEAGEKILHKFMQEIESIFSSLPRPKEWRSFYNHDLPLITDIDPSLREAFPRACGGRTGTNGKTSVSHGIPARVWGKVAVSGGPEAKYSRCFRVCRHPSALCGWLRV